MTTIHAGDHDTDCEICQANCDCQDCRIKTNLEYFDFDEGTLQDFEDLFEDRDPLEFL